MHPALLLTVGLPTLAQGLLCGLLSLGPIPFARGLRFEGLILQSEWRDWFEKPGDPERGWNFSTTLGAWMGLSQFATGSTIFHESVHIEQYVDHNMRALVLGACLYPWIGWEGWLILWGTSGMLWVVPNFVTGYVRNFGFMLKPEGLKGWTRFKHFWYRQIMNAYYGSGHEKDAYARQHNL